MSNSHSKELTVLVHLNFDRITRQDDLIEFKQLTISAGAEIVDVVVGSRDKPDVKYFVGSGKVEEIRAVVSSHKAVLVIFNHFLSAGQERNLERALQCRVLDRTGLILDIFADRARSSEGQLQVEMAQLRHLSSRLIRGWTHLERQKGGIGLRGPGETQLETDRRLIRDRIKVLDGRLEKVKTQRDQARRARRRATLPTVALVGYTNAGKSSLFNTLTNEHVYTADKLFATLDPTLRRIALPTGTDVILADTVGFIRDLPHQLIEAFHATLQETVDADLLLHVIDAADPAWHFHLQQVHEVLHKIHADGVPRIEIYNKIDLVADSKPHIEQGDEGQLPKIWLSAVTGAGIPLLLQTLAEIINKEMISEKVDLAPEQGRLRAELYEMNSVVDEQIDENGICHLQIRLKKSDFARLFERGKIEKMP